MSSIVIRALDPAEWEDFKEFRLQALQAAPGVFGSSYQAEVGQTPEEWQATVRGPGNQAFGLFDGDKLIGITAVFTWREDASGKTALLAMSFIEPEHRGAGLSKLLYKARLDWILAQPQFERVVVYHRESNEPSRRANQRHGFRPVSRSSRVWADGTVEDEVFSELQIADHHAE